MHKIYIEIDSKNRVNEIFSNFFKKPTQDSIFIKEGVGDRFIHAHLYLDKPLWEQGYNYKVIGGKIKERTIEEKEQDIIDTPRVETPLEKAEKRITQLEEELLFTNILMTDIEISSLENEDKSQSLEEELIFTNQLVTELELLIFENLPVNLEGEI